jgi:DNA-binding CsgD family transcriptional regulator/tetratricopeptide (TPR) repeat protein
MTASGTQQVPIQLLGREPECAVIDQVLAGAINGAGRALVVRGEAGLGKSALLEYAARQAADGVLVLRADGVEAESDLPFAGLHGLLRPMFRHLAELPEIQSAALAGALGLAPSASPDRLLISAAVIALLAAAADTQPVLCLVDDAQWVDRPSAEALVFAARRLQAERVAMVFGAREGEPRRFEAAGVAELRLGGLPRAAAVAVLATRTQGAAPMVRERLLTEADGNPLALLELPGALSATQLDGRQPLPAAMPLTPRLEDVFRQRAARLAPDTQTVLLIAAADTSGDAAALLRAAAELGLAGDALDAAEDAGLIRVTDRGISFRHPLVRSALYQSATLSQRQRVHATLAGALRGDENADRRVWHQAMATLGDDEEVAAALEASARRAQLRAGHASAATAFQRAAELSSDEERRTHRISAAAQAAWDAGQPNRAREAVSRALPLATGAQRGQLLHLSGLIEANTGSMRDACARFAEAADATSDPALKLQVLLEAAQAATMAGDYSKAIEIGRAAAAAPQPTIADRALGTLIHGFERELSGEFEQAQPILTEAVRLAAELGDPRALVWAANAASIAGDMGAGLPFINRAVAAARSRGLLSMLPAALDEQSLELFATSSFELAYAAAEEGYRLAIEIGHGEGWHLVNMASVEAIWGRERDARAHAEEGLAISLRIGSVFLAGFAQRALAWLELSMGRPELAADRLLPMTDPHHSTFVPNGWLLALCDAVEAAWRADRREEAIDRLAMIEHWVSSAPTPARRAKLARSQALLGLREPDQAFGEALAHGGALPAFERARTELLYGEWLRRERQRTTARQHLRTALELFQSLRAAPWAERAEAELRATGETARRRDASAMEQLTPQEAQIARLVADGLTNKEIAAQLYLSPRTVDYHLRKVFTKLGIASRTDLVRHGSPG